MTATQDRYEAEAVRILDKLADDMTVVSVHETPLDERELLQGYRDASQEVREILIDLARKATRKKDFGPRSERND